MTNAAVRTLQLPVYYLPARIDRYISQSNLPAMNEATICLWFRGVPDDDNRKEDWLLSLSAGGS